MGRGVTETDFSFSKAGNYAEELDRKSRAALSVIARTVRIGLKTNVHTQGTAGIISEDEVDEVRRILEFKEVSAGDFLVLFENSTPFFINKTLFETLYEVLSS